MFHPQVYRHVWKFEEKLDLSVFGVFVVTTETCPFRSLVSTDILKNIPDNKLKLNGSILERCKNVIIKRYQLNISCEIQIIKIRPILLCHIPVLGQQVL